MKRKRIPFLLGVALVLTLFGWLVFNDRKPVSYIYPDFGMDLPEGSWLLGIDVSHYQGKINWTDLAAMKVGDDSIRFVYIKATEGVDFVDDQLKNNAVGAQETHIPFGLYHFFHPELGAIRQADFFAEICLSYTDSLIPVLDVEITGGLKNNRMLDSVKVCMDRLEQKTGKRPMLYTYESFFDDHFKNSYLKYETYWIANYNGECGAIDLNNVAIWQFSEAGTINGIGEKVDLNIAKPEFLK